MKTTLSVIPELLPVLVPNVMVALSRDEQLKFSLPKVRGPRTANDKEPADELPPGDWNDSSSKTSRVVTLAGIADSPGMLDVTETTMVDGMMVDGMVDELVTLFPYESNGEGTHST